MRLSRIFTIAAAALAALAISGFWLASREPSYLPPPGDEIDILLELAGVFPDNYGIMWREHQLLRATDPEAQQYPELLNGALFMHKLLTTEGGQSSGAISVEVAYRFYPHDHDLGSGPSLENLTADEGRMSCVCVPEAPRGTQCNGALGFGNYEFTLVVDYTAEQCAKGISPQREQEFRRSMQTADRLIGFYLRPLRRKPRWL